VRLRVKLKDVQKTMRASPIIVRKPSECSVEELRGLISTVAKGAEVPEHYIQQGVQNARALLWMATSGEIFAVAAIKNPRTTYRRSVFEKAGVPEHAENFSLEFGYLYVDSARRGEGLGAALVDRALALVGSEAVFATTRSDNEPMRKMLPKRAFELLGNKYASAEDPSRFLCLYTRSIER
jgi:GNAT superfamily N-acetyltransferase